MVQGNSLNERQRTFVEIYTNSTSPAFGNAKQAARLAGYSKRTAESQGSRLLRNVKVKAAIEDCQQTAAERAELDGTDFIRRALHQADAWLDEKGRRVMRVVKELEDGTLVVEQIQPDATNVKVLELAGDAAGYVGRAAEASAGAQANAGV